MSKFSTLQELKDMAQDWQAQLHDRKLPANDLEVLADARWNTKAKMRLDLAGYETPVLDHAFSQLAHRLDIPAQWSGDNERCDPALRQTIYNHKLRNASGDLLLRSREAGIRAVLSDQYSAYDHSELVDATAAAIETAGLDVHVHRPEVGDEMRAYLIVKGIDFEYGGAWTGSEAAARMQPNGGDDPLPGADNGGGGGLKPALYISNSEIGTGRVRIVGGLYRSWCSNGAIIGWDREEMLAITHRFHSRSGMALMVNEAIGAALHLSEEAAERFHALRSQPLRPTQLGDIVNRWAGKYGLQVEPKENWLNRALTDSKNNEQYSVADLINAATYEAQAIEDPAQREVMERMGGDLIFARIY